MTQEDMARGDQAPGDLAPADMADPDLAVPDLATPDMAQPDLAQPDLAAPDLGAADMAAPAVSVARLQALCNAERGSLGLRAEGRLAGAPVVRLQVELRDAAGASVPFLNGGARAEIDRFEARTLWREDAARFELEAARTVAAALDQAVAVVLTVEDAEGRVGSAQVECPAPPVLPAGADGCDALGAWAVCPAGQGCGPDGRCRPASAPVLSGAAAALDPQGRSLAVAVEGRDPDGDARFAWIRLLAADGSSVAPSPMQVALRLQADAEGFLGRGGGRLPPQVVEPARVVAAEVRLVDETGLRSLAQRVAVQRPEPREAGQICDPLEAFDRCPDDQACVLLDGDPDARAVCGPAPEVCPEAWPVEALQPAAPGLWAAQGALAPDSARTAAASCAAGAAQHLLGFTAEADGRHRIRLVDPAPGLALFARSACALPAPRFELGCGADFEVFLRAGAPLTVVVAGPPGAAFSVQIAEEGE